MENRIRARIPTALLSCLSQLLIAQMVLAAGGAVLAAEEAYFSIRLSTEGRRTWLHGEEVFLQVEVSNPSAKPLLYLSTLGGRGGFISGLHIRVLRGNGEQAREVERDAEFLTSPWGETAWASSMVRSLGVGKAIHSRFSLTSMWGTLPVGTYAVSATISQQTKGAEKLDLAMGSCTSKPVEVTVLDWQLGTSLKTDIERAVGSATRKTQVQIAKTTEGGSLVSWRTGYTDDKRWRLKVVPIELPVPLQDVLWHATEETCYVTYPIRDHKAQRLIVVDENTSSVSYVTLETASATR